MGYIPGMFIKVSSSFSNAVILSYSLFSSAVSISRNRNIQKMTSSSVKKKITSHTFISFKVNFNLSDKLI